MKDYSKNTIKEIIAYLISEGFIAVKGEKYPVLALNSKAASLLVDREQLHIKRLIVKEKPKAQSSGLYADMALYEKLRQLRKEIADKQKVPPFVVFSDATLNAMCIKLPLTRETLLGVPGVGKFKLEKYGDRFIDLINEYVSGKNIIVPEADSIEVEKGRNAKEKKKDTKLITYEMYTSGKTLSEICEERELSQVTIEGHLIECLEKGLSLEYECFIPKDMEPEIMQAIEIHGTEKLKPIKEALPPEITYTAIKFAVWKYKSRTTKIFK
jgi:ATP-dependent DNA helicase RecQ